MFRERCRVVSNREVAPGHFVLTLRSSSIARAAKPGQFVQVLCSDTSDPLLPRPFSFLDAKSPDFSVLYHVVGKGTRLLSLANPGEELPVLGPLGRGFALPPKSSKKTVALVGGGVGIPPLYHAARALAASGFDTKKIRVLLGARTKDFLLCEKEFKKLGVKLFASTDDGSRGVKGFVTSLLEDALAEFGGNLEVLTCGPTPMLKSVSRLCHASRVACQVSVEVPMACGFGACIGCAIEVKDGDEKRFAMACQEGPVFSGEALAWH